MSLNCKQHATTKYASRESHAHFLDAVKSTSAVGVHGATTKLQRIQFFENIQHRLTAQIGDTNTHLPGEFRTTPSAMAMIDVHKDGKKVEFSERKRISAQDDGPRPR